MIIPSIDLMDGKVVQLRHGKERILTGELEKHELRYALFPEVNIIDLDAAFRKGTNKETIKRLCGQLRCNVGGGIRDPALAYEYLRAGAKHVIIGTCATPEFLQGLPSHKVIVALDVKDGAVRVDAWRDGREGSLGDLIKTLEPYCAGFLITDIGRDGTGAGIDQAFLASLRGLTDKRIMVSGGVAGNGDIAAGTAAGFDVVVGLAFSSGAVDPDAAFVEHIDWSKGLVPTIVQDRSSRVLMLAYSSPESLLASLKTGDATYRSRSRNTLWRKGETSGNTQRLLCVKTDCDRDALIFTVEQTGPACHTKRSGCFDDGEFGIRSLQSYLTQRLSDPPAESYTAKIGADKHKLAKKVIEEAFEFVDAQDAQARVYEAADLMYFALILLCKEGIPFERVIDELSLRHKVSTKGYR
ncbi:TPA: phosphoribosyl-ATP diphosphatase [Candidatus Woesearchaeota archaeon]|nr:phosphoribosyl-ATP diphosphatase [Candidatus Woesearchaeota archaeon]